MATLWNRAGHYIVILWFLSSIFFSSPNLCGCRLDVYHTSTHHVAVNLECRSETCCARLAENTAYKKSPKSRHLGTIPQVCRAISLQLRHVMTIWKNLLSTNISPVCLHNMVNFGPLAAEIDPVVSGTPANFNGFRVLAALLHGTRVLGISHTLRCWTEGATYIR